MLNRNKIMEQAYHDCMKEMYSRSQPVGDYDQILKDAADGKIGKNDRVYERYYLSHEEFKYILEKYIQAYNIKSCWGDHIELLQKYLEEGGTKDKYIESYTDEYGYHPGYRGYESVKPIGEQIQEILKTEIGESNVTDKISNKIAETVLNTINYCKNFYKFDREESSFSAGIALGASPSSNPDTVIEYWAARGVKVEIEERNPLLFWDQDYYGDSFEEAMEDEYGENWREYWDNEWKQSKNK